MTGEYEGWTKVADLKAAAATKKRALTGHYLTGYGTGRKSWALA